MFITPIMKKVRGFCESISPERFTMVRNPFASMLSRAGEVHGELWQACRSNLEKPIFSITTSICALAFMTTLGVGRVHRSSPGGSLSVLDVYYTY